MPTPVIVAGFEDQCKDQNKNGSLSPATIWGAGVGYPTGVTFIAGRTGGYALHVVENGTNANYIGHSFVAGNKQNVVSLYFRISSAPSVDSRVFNLSQALFYVHNADGKIYARAKSDGTEIAGPVVTDGSWHRLDAHVDQSGTTWATHWSVDGVAQTDATRAGQVATDITDSYFGSGTGSHTATIDFDDVVWSVTPGDYPMGAHRVLAIVPTADGTHATGGNILNEAAVDVGGAGGPAWSRLDEWPATTTDYFYQSSVDTNAHADVTFPDTTEPTIWGATGYCAHHLSANTLAWASFARFYDSAVGLVGTVVSGNTSNSTSLVVNVQQITTPTGGWNTGFNAVHMRFGYSSDVSPVCYFDAAMIQYAVPGDSSGDSVFVGAIPI